MIDFEKKLIKEVVVDAPVAEVWKKWTTTEGREREVSHGKNHSCYIFVYISDTLRTGL